MKVCVEPLLVIALFSLLVLTSVPGFATGSTRVRADVRVVRSLYDEFAGEAVLEGPTTQTALLDQSRTVLLRYFTAHLATLIVHDRECSVRTGEVCHLDFSPIWDSQDPTGATVILAGAAALGKVRASVRYPTGEKRILIFQLTQTSLGWRIADVAYADQEQTLLKILEARP